MTVPGVQHVAPRAVFTDTHCHIHDPTFFPGGGSTIYEQALQEGVHRMICVGTDLESSRLAVQFAQQHEQAFAAIGIHPHDAVKQAEQVTNLERLAQEERSSIQNKTPKTLVAVGEIGLDYHYMHSPKKSQIAVLEKQLDLAVTMNLPVSFHVRAAFDDFWPILSNFPTVRGVLHSFTDSLTQLEMALNKGLFIGVNGIVTFDAGRDEVTRAIPLEKMLLETDAPFLTPAPLRGKINTPGKVSIIASYVAELRGITVEELSQRTEQAVSGLFF